MSFINQGSLFEKGEFKSLLTSLYKREELSKLKVN
jgi:hypothetical protein